MNRPSVLFLGMQPWYIYLHIRILGAELIRDIYVCGT